MTGGIKSLLAAVAAAPAVLAVTVTMLVGMGQDAGAGCGTLPQQPSAPPPDDSAPPARPTGQLSGSTPAAATDSGANAIPGNYLRAYQAAGRAFGVGWTLLAGVGKVETDHGRSRLPGVSSGANYAGAKGPMQFLQPTWDAYGIDGDGDRVPDVYNPADAIAGAANYLRASGAPGNVRGALWHYNHSSAYADQVLSWTAKYAVGVTTAADSGVVCTPGGSLPAGSYGTRIVAAAMKWLGTDYLWGGGDSRGPTSGCGHGFCGRGFDCSGLTLYAVYQATGGKVTLPHFAAAQYRDPRFKPVSYDQLQPGDLVFFHDLGHVGIYVGAGRMVNAPKTFDHVRIASIRPGTSYYSGFDGARRLVLGGSASAGAAP